MSAGDLPGPTMPIPVLVIEDPFTDGSCLIRSDAANPIEVAIAHDGSDDARDQAEIHAQCLLRAQAMVTLLAEALTAFGDAFDGDAEVSGADLVEWFALWRRRLRATLGAVAQPGRGGGAQLGSSHDFGGRDVDRE